MEHKIPHEYLINSSWMAYLDRLIVVTASWTIIEENQTYYAMSGKVDGLSWDQWELFSHKKEWLTLYKSWRWWVGHFFLLEPSVGSTELAATALLGSKWAANIKAWSV